MCHACTWAGSPLSRSSANARTGTMYVSDLTPARHGRSTAQLILERGGTVAPYPELKVSPEGQEDHPSKGEMYAIGAKYFEVFVASGFCAFLININTLPLKDLVSAATGWDLSVAELLLTGERIQTLRQVFNVREGICPDDFSLPRRLQESPSFGPLKGVYIDFNKHREAYYHTMNWDPKTGYPLEACLKKLGLVELVGSLPDV